MGAKEAGMEQMDIDGFGEPADGPEDGPWDGEMGQLPPEEWERLLESDAVAAQEYLDTLR